MPVPPVEVVDTVSTSDAFGGGFLRLVGRARAVRDQLADPALLAAAAASAAQVAALTCTRAGAEPPWRQEMKVAAAGTE